MLSLIRYFKNLVEIFIWYKNIINNLGWNEENISPPAWRRRWWPRWSHLAASTPPLGKWWTPSQAQSSQPGRSQLVYFPILSHMGSDLIRFLAYISQYPYLWTDVQIMVYLGILVTRKFFSWQKISKIFTAICQNWMNFPWISFLSCRIFYETSQIRLF